MKIEKTNQQAVMEHNLVDDSVTIWQPGGLSMAIFPGTVVNVNTGWRIEPLAGEAVLLELAEPLAMVGCILAHPQYLTRANSGDLIVTIFNRSSFVVNLDPMNRICRLLPVSLSVAAAVVGMVPKMTPDAVMPPVSGTPAEGLTDRMIAAAKKIGGRVKK